MRNMLLDVSYVGSITNKDAMAINTESTASSINCITDARWGDPIRWATGCFFGSAVNG